MIPLAELLKESPFAILKKHAAKVYECVNLLPQLFDFVSNGQINKQKEITEKIFALETEADNLRDYLREQLSTSILLPMRKEDLFNIVENQDSIADSVEEIAAILSYRDMKLPDPLSNEVKQYLNEVLRNCMLAEGIMSKLDLLEESGFAGRDALTVSKLITELSQREDKIKPRQTEVSYKILNTKPPLEPVEAILWLQVIGYLSSMSKYAERVGNGFRPSFKIKI
ncbi:MAG: TIGR00153 family protein [Verrucomicrobiia bacterium]